MVKVIDSIVVRTASMRRLFPFVGFAVFSVFVGSAALSRGAEPAPPKPDVNLPNIPGAFHAYNLTGKYKGHYHSHISEYGLEPMVMIVTREVEFSDPLKALLKNIDGAIEKNPAARLHAFVVVLSDGVPEVVGADSKSDDKRLEVTTQLEDQAKALMLMHIDIVLAGKADLQKYNLDDAGFAFYLFQRAKVTASRVLKTGDKLTDAVTTEIMAVLANKAGATRK
jgi:hypothetical protein